MTRSKNRRIMQDFILVHHKLIPSALIVSNIAFPHLIYLLAISGSSYVIAGIVVSLGLLVIGTSRSNKYCLTGGILLYIIILVLSF